MLNQAVKTTRDCLYVLNEAVKTTGDCLYVKPSCEDYERLPLCKTKL